MRGRLLAFALVAFSIGASAQSAATTFIFVRHAEKVNDGSKDAELSEEGKQRAARLSQMLANQKISAVYSTNFKRTQNTVSQLAKEHGVGVTPYESLNGDQLKVLAAQYKGGTVVICGHSNTTPVMINAIRGTQEFKQWEDGDYGNLILVTVTSSGETSLTALRY